MAARLSPRSFLPRLTVHVRVIPARDLTHDLRAAQQRAAILSLISLDRGDR